MSHRLVLKGFKVVCRVLMGCAALGIGVFNEMLCLFQQLYQAEDLKYSLPRLVSCW